MKLDTPFNRLLSALPFWSSVLVIPVLIIAAMNGGWYLALPPVVILVVTSILDKITGPGGQVIDPSESDEKLTLHTAITLIWFPIQFLTIFGILIYVQVSGHLATHEKVILFYDVGLMSGAIGIVYAHELMHQKSRLERWLGDLLLASTLYGHFRSEHLLVHHRYVGTPRDAVTARYGEHFYRFFVRVLPQSFISAFRAEKELLDHKGLPVSDASNPFWKYASLQLMFLLFAIIIGGWGGLLLFLVQALTAVFLLELINYIEHYGLTRKYLRSGKYEPAAPRHSWNVDYPTTNAVLINLQRHSDHHHRPSRRFPLLQNYRISEAPYLPYSYPIMSFAALIPPVWLRMMNPRVRKWRAMFYPEITDWEPYKKGKLPLPR